MGAENFLCVCSHQVDNIIKWQPNAFGSCLPNRFKLASTFADSALPSLLSLRLSPLTFFEAKQRAELRAEVQILLCGGIICSTSVCTRKTFAPFLLSARRLKWKSRAKKERRRRSRRSRVESKSCDVSYWPHHWGKLLKKTADSKKRWMWRTCAQASQLCICPAPSSFPSLFLSLSLPLPTPVCLWQ